MAESKVGDHELMMRPTWPRRANAVSMAAGGLVMMLIVVINLTFVVDEDRRVLLWLFAIVATGLITAYMISQRRV